MSMKLTEGCFSKLASAKETTGARILSTTTYQEALQVMVKQPCVKNQTIAKLNYNTRQWIINKE